jgi:biotin carboxyl carrier protein
MRKVGVKIEGKERVVEIEDDEGVMRARVDGVEAGVEILEAEPGVWVMRRGNEQTVATVDGTGGKTVVEIRRPGSDPLMVAAEVRDARRTAVSTPSRTGAEQTGPVTVRSPIPGRVAKVLVRVEDRVTAGQTVIVLEAMKMENELRAPRAGRVASVSCTEGATVEAGQDLVVLV